jgi:hypothetical protein
MKITVKNLKPRNPFVAASLRRVAGSHAPGTVPGASKPAANCGAKSTACDPAPESTPEAPRTTRASASQETDHVDARPAC